MDTLTQALQYALDPQKDFLGKLSTHLELSGVALLFALLIGVPLGMFISRYVYEA